MSSNKKILRAPEVTEATGLSLATISRKEKRGEFPIRVKLSSRAVGWHAFEVYTWIKEKQTCCAPASLKGGRK